MKSFVDNLVVTRDEIEDTQKSVVINHSGVINYWLILLFYYLSRICNSWWLSLLNIILNVVGNSMFIIILT